jgi:hypothetical protein
LLAAATADVFGRLYPGVHIPAQAELNGLKEPLAHGS